MLQDDTLQLSSNTLSVKLRPFKSLLAGLQRLGGATTNTVEDTAVPFFFFLMDKSVKFWEFSALFLSEQPTYCMFTSVRKTYTLTHVIQPHNKHDCREM